MLKKLTTIPTWDDIQAVHKAIKPYIHQTPVLSSEGINTVVGASVFFKCENFQKVGAFKMRGASSAVSTLTEQEKQQGIATHSSGNHAQAVALSAKLNNIPAYIVMPENAPIVKKDATAGYGATIITCESTLKAREATLKKVVEETGATFLHPYNDYNIIAGQATAAKELLEEVENLEVIMTPIGGGGLTSGSALTVHYTNPNIEMIGTEPKMVDDAYRSYKSGEIQTNESTNTIADGLRTNLGTYTFGIISQYVDDIITVSEEEIVDATQLIWERMKVLVEPSSAVPLAALIQQKERFKGKRIGIIFSGGNVDLRSFLNGLKR